MIKNSVNTPGDGSNEITRQEKKAAKKKERLAKAVAKQDEALGIAGKEPMTEISAELNQDSTPVEDKSFTQYVDATGNPQKTTTIDNQTQEVVDYQPGQAVKNAISNVSTSFTGSNVVNDIVNANKDLSFEQIQDLAGRAANVGELKAQQEKENQLVLQTEGNALAEQVQQQIGEGVEVQTKETPTGVETTETITGGGMGTGVTGAPEARPIGSVVSTQGVPAKPSYEQVTPKGKVEKDLASLNQQAMAMDLITPDAVLEKLDVRDYYPEAGKDVAVGMWTGSVLGSQTIYSGAGTLLPMGLYDARKRAIATAAKQKQDIIDKMVELPNTADQFQRNYQEHGYQNIIEAGLEKYGSYEKMVKSPEWRRDMARFKNLGIELSYADKQADKLLTALGEGKWVPKDVREAAYNLKNGMGDSIDDILNGKTSVLKETSKLRSYENGTAHVDELVKEGIFDNDRLSELPINLNTGEAMKDPKEYDRLIRAVNGDGSIDNDTYVKLTKKFFDTSKVYGLVDAWIKGNNADPNTREAMADYMIAQIPQKVISDFHSMGNQAFERERLGFDRYKFEKEFQLEVEKGKTPAEVKDEAMLVKKDEQGYTLADRLNWIKGQNLSPEQKKKQILYAYSKVGLASWDPVSKAAVIEGNPSPEMAKKPIPKNGQQLKIRINNAKGVEVELTPRQLANMGTDYIIKNYRRPDGTKIKLEEVTAFKEGQAVNRLGIVPTRTQSTIGTIDRTNKTLKTLSSDELSKADMKTMRTIERVRGNAIALGKPIFDKEGNPVVDPATQEVQYQTTPLFFDAYYEENISSVPGRNNFDAVWSTPGVKISQSRDEGMNMSGSSSGNR